MDQPLLDLLQSGLTDEDMIANFNKNQEILSPTKRTDNSGMS